MSKIGFATDLYSVGCGFESRWGYTFLMLFQ